LNNYLPKGFEVLEKLISKKSAKYCIGDEITIADIYLVPQIYAAKRFNIDLSKYKEILRVSAELEKIPEFHDAHPHRQPDTPIELKEI
jgi:glutathione S-transferase